MPFFIDGHAVGSVAREHLALLRVWPQWLAVDDASVRLIAHDADAALAAINATLRDTGQVRGWRNELYAIVDPATRRRVARTERAAARFWGTLTLGAHANGYLADGNSRPTHLWIARRSMSKATDPGLFDNLIGGGVPDGQTPHEALLREGFEEAGLDEARMRSATPGRVLRVQRDIAEGLQVEDLHVWDLLLPPGLTPVNQDGEVASFTCLPVADALALAAGDTMTVDAALATLDFALRRGLLSLPAGAAAIFSAG